MQSYQVNSSSSSTSTYSSSTSSSSSSTCTRSSNTSKVLMPDSFNQDDLCNMFASSVKMKGDVSPTRSFCNRNNQKNNFNDSDQSFSSFFGVSVENDKGRHWIPLAYSSPFDFTTSYDLDPNEYRRNKTESPTNQFGFMHRCNSGYFNMPSTFDTQKSPLKSEANIWQPISCSMKEIKTETKNVTKTVKTSMQTENKSQTSSSSLSSTRSSPFLFDLIQDSNGKLQSPSSFDFSMLSPRPIRKTSAFQTAEGSSPLGNQTFFLNKGFLINYTQFYYFH
jgi:hypothetical protein